MTQLFWPKKLILIHSVSIIKMIAQFLPSNLCVLSVIKKRTKEAFFSVLGKPAIGTSAKVIATTCSLSVSFSLEVLSVDNFKHYLKLGLKWIRTSVP